MRLKQYIDEWKVISGYSGWDIGKIYEGDVILWYYMAKPENKGLLWTITNGDTFLNNKKIGNINYPNEKLTHKKQISTFYNQLGLNKSMSGNLRQDIDELYDMNVRGRIIRNEIHAYKYHQQEGIFNQKAYKKLIDKAINMIYKYIDEDKYGIWD